MYREALRPPACRPCTWSCLHLTSIKRPPVAAIQGPHFLGRGLFNAGFTVLDALRLTILSTVRSCCVRGAFCACVLCSIAFFSEVLDH